jgi:hypothetical protein
MKKKYFILFTLLFSQKLLAQSSCATETGVNLSKHPGPYAYMSPTNQGRLGTCFAHSATNLLRSYMGVSDYANIIDAATISDEGVDGGHVSSVIQGFLERSGKCYKNGKLYVDAKGAAILSPWMCKDNGMQFSNMFPSTEQNILTELEAILVPLPVHYTYTPTTKEGIVRTNQIADAAIKMVHNQVNQCQIVEPYNKNHDAYLTLVKDVSKIEDKIKKLKDEKSAYGTEWMWTTFGYRSNSSIDADIAVQKNKLKVAEQKKEKAYNIYVKKEEMLDAGKSNFSYLDKLSVAQAAEIVSYWAEQAYPEYKAVFKKYGIEKYAGSIDQFIKERVEYHPVHGFAYAGRLYAYKMVKKAIEGGCDVSNRICLDKDLKNPIPTMKVKGNAAQADKKIQSLLTQAKPQGIGVYIPVSILDGTSRGDHAVNIIGCRTVKVNGQPTMQYLIHNSWGMSCSSYKSNLRGSDRCESGRVWIDSMNITNTASEIQWLSK